MRITPWKKVVVATAVVAASVGAGAAWAQDSSNNPGPPQSAQADTRMTGGGTTETKFVPVNPCRLVDTRAGGGKFANGTTRRFDVRGTGATFAAQGGQANGCGIPNAGVSAVEITISAVDPGGKGFLRAFPTTPPSATFLSYTAGTDIGNTGTVALCGADGGICLINQDLGVKNFGATTHVVIDVNGYYTQPISVLVSPFGSMTRGSRNESVDNLSTGTRIVKFDRDVSKCVYAVSVGNPDSGTPNGYAAATPFGVNPQKVFVQTFDENQNLANLGFHLTVTC